VAAASQDLPADLPVIRVRDLSRHVGERVVLRGWLWNQRGKGRLWFLLLRDGSGIVQCVVKRDAVGDDCFEAARSLTQESSFSVWGEVRADERARGGHELVVEGLTVHQRAEGYPITPKEHGVGFLLDHRHLWIRSRRQAALLRVRHRVAMAMREWLDAQGFVCVDAPIFTPNACEGTSTLFEVDYFGRPAYLSQSGQLYEEAAAMALGRVYSFGPTFRAEKSKTRRHLTEFWMLEPEIAFADLDEVCATAEGMVRHVLREVVDRCEADLADLERDPDDVLAWDRPWPRLRYHDVARQLVAWQEEERYQSEFTPGDDLGAPDETVLGEEYGCPVFVTHWPAEVKAFYMKRDPEDPSLALALDVIAPVAGEIVGGSVREEDEAELRRRIREHDLPEESFEWYLDLRRFGSVPHGGFGIGLERTVSWITGVEHVRECIPFPRTIQRLTP